VRLGKSALFVFGSQLEALREGWSIHRALPNTGTGNTCP